MRAVMQFLVAFLVTLVSIGLLLPVLIITLPFLVMGILVRVLARIRKFEVAGWRNIIQFDSVVGWKPQPSLDCYAKADSIFHLTTGTDGWRTSSCTIEESEVVAFGDSFLFGYGVDDERVFWNQANAVKIKAIGCVGYNMVQAVLLMREYAPQIAGKQVHWYIFLGNDLTDNLQPSMKEYRTPFVREQRSEWGIETDHLNASPWPIASSALRFPADLAAYCSTSSINKRVFSAGEFLIKLAFEEVSKVNAHLTVITIPDRLQLSDDGLALLRSLAPVGEKFDPAYPDQVLGDICKRVGVDHFALKDYLDSMDYNQLDRHWNKEGHQKVATILYSVRE